MVKRCVLRPVLKIWRVGASLSDLGRAFHRVGAANEKALSPHVRSLVLGTTRRFASPDLREREGT